MITNSIDESGNAKKRVKMAVRGESAKSKVDLLGDKVIKEIHRLIDKGHKGTSIRDYIEDKFKKELKEIPSAPTIDRYAKMYLASKKPITTKEITVVRNNQKGIQKVIVEADKTLNLTDMNGMLSYAVSEIQATVEYFKQMRVAGTLTSYDSAAILQGCRQLKEIVDMVAESADKLQPKDTTEQIKINERCDCIGKAAIDAVKEVFGEDVSEEFMKRFAELITLYSGE